VHETFFITALSISIVCHNAECRNAKCHNAKCRNAECRFAECRGTNLKTLLRTINRSIGAPYHERGSNFSCYLSGWLTWP